MNGSTVSIDHVSKHFGSFHALDDVNITIKQGEFFSLLGPSGCGKTTLLRIIAGFEFPDDGAVLFDLRKGRFPQAHDGLGRGGLAAAGFPYKGQGLALVHVEGHPPNGLDLPRIGVEGDL